MEAVLQETNTPSGESSNGKADKRECRRGTWKVAGVDLTARIVSGGWYGEPVADGVSIKKSTSSVL